YLIDAPVAEEVLGTARGLAFFGATVRRQILRTDEHRIAMGADANTIAVASLIPRKPVTCDPSTTVRDAAALMARERVSSLIVPVNGRLGILTDRDLRTKVVAAALPFGTPVEQVMTFPAVTVPPETMAAEVLSL